MPIPVHAPVPLDALAYDPSLLDPLPERFRFLVLDESALDMGIESQSTSSGFSVDIDIDLAPRLVAYPFDASARITIGRSSAKSDLVVRDRRISGLHAALSPAGTHAWLVDLASSNGTFLESRCIAPGEAGRVALGVGARFSLSQIQIRFLDKPLLRQMIDAFSPLESR